MKREYRLKDIATHSKGKQINGNELVEDGKYIYLNGGINPSGRWNEFNVAGDTVTISEGGNSSGYVNYIEEPFWCGAHCYYLYNVKGNSKYLYYALKSNQKLIMNLRTGAAMPNLKKSALGEFSFVYDSDATKQNEVVQVLERVELIIKHRIKQLIDLDNLIKSRFVEMFGDPIKNDKKWETRKLNDVCPVNRYKGQVESTNGQVWLLNLDMIESNTGKIHNYVLEDESKISSSIIKFDTNCVLYSKLRPYLNKVVIPTRSGYATSEMIAMQTNIVDKYFLSNLLRMKSFVDFANGTSYGAKMPRASVDMIKNFDLIFPPKELQNNFAQFAQQVDKTKLAIQKSIDETQKLFDSLMQEYFG